MKTTACKVFTHDLCSPIQGGEPVWDGELPFRLPAVKPSKSDDECAPGRNACRTAEDALRIAGFWPNGRPSRLFRVETTVKVIERGDKLRASTWTICEELTTEPAIRALSAKWCGEHAEAMAVEQLAWRHALSRPNFEPNGMGEKLAAALVARNLTWRLRQFDSCADAWAAWAAWAAWDASAAWGDARDAWAAWAAWAAWGDARDARDASAAWDARDAWGDARDARDASAARDACIVSFAARSGWIKHAENLLTVGIRDAYEHGLGIAIPTGPNELGWAMDEQPVKKGTPP